MFSMDKLDDEYWLLSATKGFDFGSEENVQVSFLISYNKTSKRLQPDCFTEKN